MISLENYEEYMMLHADGELQPAGEQELIAFLDIHPELKNEMATYQLTRIHPDETLIYNHKNSLLKQEPIKRAMAFPQWGRYAIAAGVAALIFISFFKYREINKNAAEIAKVDTIKSILSAPVNNIQVQNNPKPQQNQESIAASPVQPHKTMPTLRHEEHLALTHNKQEVNKKQNNIAIEYNTPAATRTTTEISSLAVTGMKRLPCEESKTPIAETTVPEISLIADNTGKRSFWDKLPIEENKKKNLENIAGAVADVYDGIGKAKEDLIDTKISIRIENKKLKISF